MKAEEQDFVRRFFRAVVDRLIEFDAQDERRYVRIYDDPAFAEHDPVKLLSNSITLLPGQSAQLLSGFRGNWRCRRLRRIPVAHPSSP